MADNAHEGSWPRTVVVDLDVYRFEDLDSTAQARAAEHEIELSFTMQFNEYVDMELVDRFGFTNEELGRGGIEYYYDMSCSQGSGFRLCGEFDTEKLLNVGCAKADEIGEGVSKEDLDRVVDLVKQADPAKFNMASHNNYTYSEWYKLGARCDLQDHIINAAEAEGIIEYDDELFYGAGGYVWSEGSGHEVGSSLETDGTLAVVDRVCAAACAGMDSICADFYEAGENEIDFFYDPARYEDMYFTSAGSYWGNESELEAAMQRTSSYLEHDGIDAARDAASALDVARDCLDASKEVSEYGR